MSLWQFSESSQPLLEKCLELAAVDNSNKWMEKFGKQSPHQNQNDEVLDTNEVSNNVVNENSEISNNPIATEAVNVDENPNTTSTQEENLYRAILNLEPVTNFDYIVTQCLENRNLYLVLAKQLPILAIEKLCKHLNNTPNIDTTFVYNFYTIFFPAFLKRELTRLSLDLLAEAKNNPIFKELLVIIIKDVEFPSSVLKYYVSTLNNNEQTEFLVNLSKLHISSEVFLHHLSTIHTVYKNSQKTIDIQNFILMTLSQVSQHCVTDKQYGCFLLSFLKAHRDFSTDILQIENMIDTHKSAYKRPCLNLLIQIKHG